MTWYLHQLSMRAIRILKSTEMQKFRKRLLGWIGSDYYTKTEMPKI